MPGYNLVQHVFVKRDVFMTKLYSQASPMQFPCFNKQNSTSIHLSIHANLIYLENKITARAGLI